MSTTISGNHGAISLNPATATNPIYVTGKISASSGVALYAPSGATWTISNTGSILNSGGIGVDVDHAAGTFTNGPTTGGSGDVSAATIGVLFNGNPGTVA